MTNYDEEENTWREEKPNNSRASSSLYYYVYLVEVKVILYSFSSVLPQKLKPIHVCTYILRAANNALGKKEGKLFLMHSFLHPVMNRDFE